MASVKFMPTIRLGYIEDRKVAQYPQQYQWPMALTAVSIGGIPSE
jgi:hypothetical protein